MRRILLALAAFLLAACNQGAGDQNRARPAAGRQATPTSPSPRT